MVINSVAHLREGDPLALASPCAAASVHNLTASSTSWATPVQSACMAPRLYWALASPCAAASVYSRTASWQSWATPLPAAYIAPRGRWARPCAAASANSLTSPGTPAAGVHGSKVALGAGMTLCGGQCVQPDRLLAVLGHAHAVLVHGSKVALGVGIALCGGQRVQPGCLLEVLGHACAACVHGSKAVLGLGIALCGSQCVQPNRLIKVLGQPRLCCPRAWLQGRTGRWQGLVRQPGCTAGPPPSMGHGGRKLISTFSHHRAVTVRHQLQTHYVTSKNDCRPRAAPGPSTRAWVLTGSHVANADGPCTTSVSANTT